MLPYANAAISSEDGGGELWFSCDDANTCSLTEFHTGETSISGSVNSATPFSPERVVIEFEMAPEQSELALLPDVIDELQVDLRYQDDIIGLSRPDIVVSIIIDESNTILEFEGDSNPTDGISGPHYVEDEPLNLEGDRLLWPGERIKIILEFELERPGTWELFLRGSSFLFLDIIWSEDIQSRNTDEPSSDASPKETDFDENHYGALLGDDRDCWKFEIENHEVMRATFLWEDVPSEIEQSHGQPDLILPDRRLAPSPELLATQEEGQTRMTWQWRALPTGEHTMCIGGRLNAFQPYQWAGVTAFESSGPLDPSGFDGSKYIWPELGMISEDTNSEELHGASGSMILVLSLAMIIGILIEIRKESTSNKIRYGIIAPGMLILLLGGIISPMWMMAGESVSTDDYGLDELIDDRLDQLWHASHPGTPASSRALHVGATFGMLDGEYLQVRLVTDSALQLDDGRWQLHIPAIKELDIESLIFNKVAENNNQVSTDNLLDSHSRSFILLSARSLILDLMMLESLLIVEDLPQSNVVNLDIEMTTSGSIGLVKDPAWSTRPVDIPEGRWRLIQKNLFPSRIMISMCDCQFDDLEINIEPKQEIDHNMLVNSEGINPVSSLVESQYLWIIGGMAFVTIGVIIENKRRKKARAILSKIASENLWV
jgi:hypothetical protein